jgi:tetratricopeptide (TPR) repeat protein
MANEANQMLFEEVAAQIQQASLLAEQGDLIGAEALYHKVLELRPDHPQALYGLAQLAGAIDDQEVKEILLSQAIEQLVVQIDLGLQNLIAPWLTELAEVLFKLNRPDEAMDCLKQCEELIAESLKAPPTC